MKTVWKEAWHSGSSVSTYVGGRRDGGRGRGHGVLIDIILTFLKMPSMGNYRKLRNSVRKSNSIYFVHLCEALIEVLFLTAVIS